MVTRVGIVGTGFVGRGMASRIASAPEFRLTKVLTRRPLCEVTGIRRGLLTRSVVELIDNSDIVIEVTGDAIFATDVLHSVIEAGLPVVTMDSEFHVTTGSYFVDRGYITEADGDQPGCLARLDYEAREMGFSPLAYVNLKKFLNPTPTVEDMRYWAKKQSLRLAQVTSFTDGSKLQIEQALVANGLGGAIARDGLIGAQLDDLRDTEFLVDEARRAGRPIADFVLAPNAPPGVMILAEHREATALGDYGPFAGIRTANGACFMLVRTYHLCHLEILRTLRSVVAGAPPLLHNSSKPTVGVAAVAKRPLPRDLVVERALGSEHLRGRAVRIRDHGDHVPICLVAGARLRRALEPGQLVTFDDVELPESRALEVYLAIRERTLGSTFQTGGRRP